MNETLRDWLDKAEGDYRTARRELAVDSTPNFDAVCFHAQQCVEKLLKAVLIANQVTPRKTHDLIELSREVQGINSRWTWPEQELLEMTQVAVEVRYPSLRADRELAEKQYERCERLRPALLALIEEAGR